MPTKLTESRTISLAVRQNEIIQKRCEQNIERLKKCRNPAIIKGEERIWNGVAFDHSGINPTIKGSVEYRLSGKGEDERNCFGQPKGGKAQHVDSNKLPTKPLSFKKLTDLQHLTETCPQIKSIRVFDEAMTLEGVMRTARMGKENLEKIHQERERFAMNTAKITHIQGFELPYPLLKPTVSILEAKKKVIMEHHSRLPPIVSQYSQVMLDSVKHDPKLRAEREKELKELGKVGSVHPRLQALEQQRLRICKASESGSALEMDLVMAFHEHQRKKHKEWFVRCRREGRSFLETDLTFLASQQHRLYTPSNLKAIATIVLLLNRKSKKKLSEADRHKVVADHWRKAHHQVSMVCSLHKMAKSSAEEEQADVSDTQCTCHDGETDDVIVEEEEEEMKNNQVNAEDDKFKLSEDLKLKFKNTKTLKEHSQAIMKSLSFFRALRPPNKDGKSLPPTLVISEIFDSESGGYSRKKQDQSNSESNPNWLNTSTFSLMEDDPDTASLEEEARVEEKYPLLSRLRVCRYIRFSRRQADIFSRHRLKLTPDLMAKRQVPTPVYRTDVKKVHNPTGHNVHWRRR